MKEKEEYLGNVKNILKRIDAISDVSNKLLYLLSSINSYLESKGIGRMIIVGGFAVELYSGGTYRTGDIDIIIENARASKIVREILKEIGFERTGRIYLSEEFLEKAIDIVGVVYDKPKEPVKIEINNFWIYILPPEETIISCLSAFKYWNSDVDFEKSAMVLKAQEKRIDWEYLERRAREEGVIEELRRIRDLVSSI